MSAARKPWSIRRRLTRRVLWLVLLAWLGAMALATVFLDNEINEMLDEELQAMAETTVLYIEASPGQVIPRNIGTDPGNGERVLRILRAGDPVPAAPWPTLTTDGFHDLNDWRVLRVTAENAVIEVAHNDAWRRDEMLEAASAFLVLILPMVALLVWGLRQSLARGFAPLEALSAGIAARSPADLSPVPEAGLPDELHPLASGLNQYIARIGTMRDAERAFVANASHELRTPVAAIRARLDLSDDPEARGALPMLDALTRRVERLLQLSRSEAGLGLGRGPADLIRITRLLLREIGLREAGSGQIRFDDGDLETLPVAVDPDALAILLRNLIENAVGHGTGPVLIRIGSGAAAQVLIENPTSGTEFHDQAFAKRPGSTGTGLGLTISDQLATAMGTRISRQILDGRARVEVSFPLAAVQSPI
ncbi:sensor histidine kinase [Pseudogemmobacter bohemicus]|uniref:sensor histidine kinase n=1 Tax=Pseudogemmobacter bohemicus TaxID=2250708 RepID=UPI000DD41ECB|nr:histidine kinase dimerization/phospho-acceptor domain-containing protein [Pseudogemmobacter bohemicus]